MVPGRYHSPATHGLRYDQVRFKASHNSYAKKESLAEQLAFDRKHPQRRGFRGLELDVHQDTKGCTWCVRHEIGGCVSTDRQEKHPVSAGGCLDDWLRVLVAWSDANPGHDVVTVTIDLKKIVRPATFRDEFHKLLKACRLDPSRLVLPAEVDGVWPTLGAMRGRFLLCLSGKEAIKSSYAEKPEAWCFADIGLGPRQKPPVGDPRLFCNYNWRLFERGSRNVFEKPTGRPYATRAYYLRKDRALQSWEGAVKAGINVLSTDWMGRLTVGGEPFVKI